MSAIEISSLVPGEQPAGPADSPSLRRFFTGTSRCSPAGHADVLLVQADYTPAYYHDDLYGECRLPFPSHLHKAVAKRRAEYLASRICVRDTLAQLGHTDFLLRNDADRAPVWPQGITGSLSHTQACISLLLTRTTAGKLLGVDCEEIMQPAIAEEMREMIINAQEQAVLQNCGLPFATALTAAFSLKESLYKALFPVFRQFMNFNEAVITSCEPEMAKVTLRLNRDLSARFRAGKEFTGCVTVDRERLTSWIITPQG